ncbi:TPA: O29 family O-antigen polymerase, partial [Escherichia coli]|nr:O29 family O-antigen polymerase [Escherichia coli]
MTVSIYLLLLAFVFLLAMSDFFIIADARNRFLLYIILFSLLVTFIGLRYQTGLDWLFYNNLFNGEGFSLAIEPGYYFFSYVSSFLMGYWIYQALITAVLIICLKTFFEKNTKNY